MKSITIHLTDRAFRELGTAVMLRKMAGGIAHTSILDRFLLQFMARVDDGDSEWTITTKKDREEKS